MNANQIKTIAEHIYHIEEKTKFNLDDCEVVIDRDNYMGIFQAYIDGFEEEGVCDLEPIGRR